MKKKAVLIFIALVSTVYLFGQHSTTNLQNYYGKWVGATGEVIIEINKNGTGVIYKNNVFSFTGNFEWEKEEGDGRYGIRIMTFRTPETSKHPLLITSQDIKFNASNIQWKALNDNMLFTITPDIVYRHIADKK